MMILGSVLLLLAVAVLVVLLTRLSSGRPAAFERIALSGLAIALILGGTGIFAAEFLSNSRSTGRSTENPANQDNANANNLAAQLPPQSEPLTERERANLDWLHRSTVEVFIDRPGFGHRRLLLPLQDVVTPPKTTSSSVADARQSDQSQKLDPAIAKMMKERDSHYAFHDLINKRWRGSIDGTTEVWSVRSVQLVGLVKNARPVAYDSTKVPGMKDVKELPTRDLNAFESHALESLRTGERVVADKTGKSMRVMAPIFAGNRCLSCHEQKGQMLGAFTYVLELGPPPKVPVPLGLQ